MGWVSFESLWYSFRFAWKMGRRRYCARRVCQVGSHIRDLTCPRDALVGPANSNRPAVAAKFLADAHVRSAEKNHVDSTNACSKSATGGIKTTQIKNC